MTTIKTPTVYTGEMREKILQRLKFGYTNAEVCEELHISKNNKFYRTARELRAEYNLGVPKRITCMPNKQICRSCIYLGAYARGCDFYYWTNELRGCDPGTGCTRYVEGKSIHKIKGTAKMRYKASDET